MKHFTYTSMAKGLAIKAALLLSLNTFAISAMAGEKIDQRLDADPNSLVQIEHTSGKAKIIAWDKNEVRIEGELGDDTKDFIFQRSGKSIEITIKAEQEGSWGSWNNGSIDGDDIKIYVPTNSRVEYDAVNADVDIDEVKGGANIEVVNGDIDANNLAGKIELQTVNGSIDGQGLEGALKIETVNGDVDINQSRGDSLEAEAVNGDIKIRTSAKDIELETVNGDIDMSTADISTLEATTVNGNIDFDLNLLSGARVDINSVGGRIELTLASDLEAKFDIEAHAGGSIKNSFSDDKPSKAEYGPRRWLSFSSGAANATIDITTVHGSIVLSKK